MIKCKNPCPIDKFDGCCFNCDFHEGCNEFCELNPNDCGDAIFENVGENAVEPFEKSNLAIIQEVVNVINEKKALDEKEKWLKEQLQAGMEKFNVKKFESELLNITYVPESKSNRFDSTNFKKKYPELYKEYQTTSKRSAYIRIKVK